MGQEVEMELSLGTIQQRIGGEITGDPGAVMTGVNGLGEAAEGDITFAEKARYVEAVRASSAGAIVVGEDFPDLPGRNLLRIREPRTAFVRVMSLFYREEDHPAGVHPSAVVAAGAELGEGVSIGACAVIGEGTRIGRGSVVSAGAHIGRGASIGEDCRIGPNAAVMHGVRLGDRVRVHGCAVIGGDGFGYVWADGHHLKIPQMGTVEIEDDVEIGCNSCVDRATLAVTRVRRGTKIDNQVHIGHNCEIGEDVIITGQVGLSGDVRIGDRAMFGGQACVAEHITIGEDARIGGASVVTKDVQAGETIWGFPSRPMAKVLREMASVARLPRLLARFRDFASRLAGLEERVTFLEGGGEKSAPST
ncbi:MAG: UDP-3-O-(3-hydroxymyristoyl)glucosamine N-acyltransferase [Alphaproteobacteria bacterium]